MYRNRVLAVMTAVAMLSVVVLAAGCSSSDSSRKLVLLHTSDEHSHLLAVGPEVDDYPPSATPGSGNLLGGIARRATILAAERDAAKKLGAATLTVSSGDIMMGTLSQVPQTNVSPDLRAAKQLGYDVVTLGNHDFELSPDYLAATITAAAAKTPLVPVVLSNIHFKGNDQDKSLQAMYDDTGKDDSKPLHLYRVVTASNGLKVGFAGVMGARAAHVAPGKAPITFSLPDSGSETDYKG
ncbi:MAG: hypothetical protein WC889_18020, partial [Myxococcota bacterium]